jgi:hypothetical protein
MISFSMIYYTAWRFITATEFMVWVWHVTEKRRMGGHASGHQKRRKNMRNKSLALAGMAAGAFDTRSLSFLVEL